MSNRKFFPELFGMAFYKTFDGEYFYAWSAAHAIRKKPAIPLVVINDYGEEIKVGTTWHDQAKIVISKTTSHE